MPTDKQVLEALREVLAWELTDEQFPWRKRAYDLLKANQRLKPGREVPKELAVKKTPTKPVPDTDPNAVVWQPMFTVPRGIQVEVLSKGGLVRRVTVHENQKPREDGFIQTWGPVGSIVATKWRRI